MIHKYVRPATGADALALGPKLRDEDKAEALAAYGLPPDQTLAISLGRSKEAYTMLKDGELAGMFGVCPTDHSDVGSVWLLATPLLVTNWLTFLRHARTGRDWLHQSYPILWAFADERNTVHLKWLEWMGFNIINRHPEFGVEKRPFLEAVRGAECVTG